MLAEYREDVVVEDAGIERLRARSDLPRLYGGADPRARECFQPVALRSVLGDLCLGELLAPFLRRLRDVAGLHNPLERSWLPCFRARPERPDLEAPVRQPTDAARTRAFALCSAHHIVSFLPTRHGCGR